MLIKQKTAACDTLAPQAPSALWERTKAPRQHVSQQRVTTQESNNYPVPPAKTARTRVSVGDLCMKGLD